MESCEPSSMEPAAVECAAMESTTMESTSLRGSESAAGKPPTRMERAIRSGSRPAINAIRIMLAHGVVLPGTPSYRILAEVMVIIQVPVSISVSAVAIKWRAPHAPR